MGVWSGFPVSGTCYSTFLDFFPEVKSLFLANLIDPFRDISVTFCLIPSSMPFSSVSSLLATDLLPSGPGKNFGFELIPHQHFIAPHFRSLWRV